MNKKMRQLAVPPKETKILMQLVFLMGIDCTFAFFSSFILLGSDVMTPFNYQYILVSFYLCFLTGPHFFTSGLLIVLLQVRYIPMAEQGVSFSVCKW